MDVLNDTGDLSSGNVSLTEVLDMPIPRILGLVKAKLKLDDRKITKLKEEIDSNKDDKKKKK